MESEYDSSEVKVLNSVSLSDGVVILMRSEDNDPATVPFGTYQRRETDIQIERE